MVQHTFVYQIFVLPTSCELPSSAFKSQITTPSILLYLAEDDISVRVSVILQSYSVFLGLSHVHVIKLLCDFSPVNLSHVNLVLRPARRT